MCSLCERNIATHKYFLQDDTAIFVCHFCYEVASKHPFEGCFNGNFEIALLKDCVSLVRNIQYAEPQKILKLKGAV